MFWYWFFELYFMTFPGKQPCPVCHLRPSENCGFLEYDPYNGDYDCVAPEDDLDCDGCKYLTCSECVGRIDE